MHRLQSITLLVSDLQKSILFYTQALHFKQKQMMATGKDPDRAVLISGKFRDTEIHLRLASSPRDRAAVGNQAGDQILFYLESSDSQKDAEALSAKGVEILESDNSGFVFHDLYKNKIRIVQAVKYDSYSI